jgi:hypothetical protein
MGFILYLADLSVSETLAARIPSTALMSRMPIPRTNTMLIKLTISEDIPVGFLCPLINWLPQSLQRQFCLPSLFSDYIRAMGAIDIYGDFHAS